MMISHLLNEAIEYGLKSSPDSSNMRRDRFIVSACDKMFIEVFEADNLHIFIESFSE